MNVFENELAPIKCEKHIDKVFHSLEANDADLHAHNLTNWLQEYDQISSGTFYGCITELSFDGLQVFKEHTSQAVRQSCMIPKDCIWIGFSADAYNGVRINGNDLLPEEVMCKASGEDFELITPEDYDIFGLVVNKKNLENSANLQNISLPYQDFSDNDQLNLPNAMSNNIRFLMGRLLSSNNLNEAKSLSHDLAMMLILEILQNSTHTIKNTVAFRRRKLVVDTVKAYVNQNSHEAISILQLCEVANVSRRTLQYSFESILGISPLQFLRTSRLNGARRALGSQQSASVSEVATQWGFWHLSQFSQDYKNLFGELPSQTLNR